MDIPLGVVATVAGVLAGAVAALWVALLAERKANREEMARVREEQRADVERLQAVVDALVTPRLSDADAEEPHRRRGRISR